MIKLNFLIKLQCHFQLSHSMCVCRFLAVCNNKFLFLLITIFMTKDHLALKLNGAQRKKKKHIDMQNDMKWL